MNDNIKLNMKKNETKYIYESPQITYTSIKN